MEYGNPSQIMVYGNLSPFSLKVIAEIQKLKLSREALKFLQPCWKWELCDQLVNVTGCVLLEQDATDPTPTKIL